MTTTSVVLHVQKTRHIAEATIHAKGVQLHADAEGADMYAAIDALADKLDRQVLKHKEKLSSHHRAEGSQRKQNTALTRPSPRPASRSPPSCTRPAARTDPISP